MADRPPVRLLRSSTIHVLADLVLRIGALLVLPLYCRLLGDAAYGQLGVVNALVTCLLLTTGFLLPAALFRWEATEPDPQRRSQARTTIMVMVVAFIVVMSLVLGGLGPWVWPSMFPGLALQPVLPLVMALVVMTLLGQLPGQLLHAQGRHGHYRLGQVMGFAGGTLGAVVLVMWGWGIPGVLLGGIGGAFVSGIWWRIALGRISWGLWQGGLAREVFAYILPQLPYVAATWTIELGPRLFLESRVSSLELAGFVIATQYAGALSAVLSAVNSAWMPGFLSGQSDGTAEQVPQIHWRLGWLLGAVAIFMGPVLLPWIFGTAGQAALPVVPWLIFGVVCSTVCWWPCGNPCFRSGDTTPLAVAGGVGAGLFIAALAPSVAWAGATGAAWAQTAGYAAMSLWAWWRFPPLGSWGRSWLLALIMLLLVGMAWSWTNGDPWRSGLIAVVFALIGGFGVMTLWRSALAVRKPTEHR